MGFIDYPSIKNPRTNARAAHYTTNPPPAPIRHLADSLPHRLMIPCTPPHPGLQSPHLHKTSKEGFLSCSPIFSPPPPLSPSRPSSPPAPPHPTPATRTP